jgi:hypothetical protein
VSGGYPRSERHLASEGSPEASAALDYLLECEAAGDFTGFTGFTVETQARGHSNYYLG